MTDLDPTLMPLDELRELRSSLQRDDDAISYVRRLAQARLDLVEAEMSRRDASLEPSVVTSEYASVKGCTFAVRALGARAKRTHAPTTTSATARTRQAKSGLTPIERATRISANALEPTKNTGSAAARRTPSIFE